MICFIAFLEFTEKPKYAINKQIQSSVSYRKPLTGLFLILLSPIFFINNLLLLNSILLILIFAGMATDTFATIYLNGFLKEARKHFVFKIAISIVLINMVYVGLGFSGGQWLHSLISSNMQVVAPAILFLLGLKIVIKSFNSKFHEMTWELTSTPVMLGYASAVGINIFMLGIILPFLSASFKETLITVAMVFATAVTVAFFFGRKSHRFLLAMRVLLAGGVLVMGIALFLLLERFNVL